MHVISDPPPSDPALAETLPLLIAVPHSSAHIPQDILHDMLGAAALDVAQKQAFLDDVFLAGDPYTEQLFWVDNAYYLEATASRFVIDVNRSPHNDSINGVIKQHDFTGKPLYAPEYHLSEAERQRRFAEFYNPFHQRYRQLLKRVDFYLDVHSMLPTGPAIAPDSSQQRPAFCLMTGGDARGEAVVGEAQGVPAALARALQSLLQEHFTTLLEEEVAAGRSAEVRLNSPWPHAGIGAFYDDHNTLGIGIEINQAMYMQAGKVRAEQIGRINQSFQSFAKAALELAQDYSGQDYKAKSASA